MNFKGHRYITKPDGSTDDGWVSYTCGHCGRKVAGAVVAYIKFQEPTGRVIFNKWLLCTNCSYGSVSINNEIFPGSPFGPQLQGLPSEVKESYQEARRCIEVNAYTAAELICRKILMHIAVEKGAKEGDSFATYITYLESSGYVTPPMKKWVDLIRQHGNHSTHKLEAPEKHRAESTVMFTAELLRLTYEMEYMAAQYTK